MLSEWRVSEERELVGIRAQLDGEFASSKGNAVRQARLWELVSARMSNPCGGQECRRRWKTLVSRYKARREFASTSSDPDFPLFEDIHAVYKSRPTYSETPAARFTISPFSEEETSSNNDTPYDEDDESDEENQSSRDVQAVLEDLFQRMPAAAPSWPWPDSTAQEQQHQLEQENPIPLTICKQEELVLVDDRIPRWGYAETKDFVAIRAEMERDPSLHAHKNLWEPISSRMKQQGYVRSAEQCRRKWKKLANRYKGKITNGQDNGRKFPVFQDLDDLFKARLQTTVVTAAAADEKQPVDLNGEVQSEDGEDESVEVLTRMNKKRKTTDGMNQVLAEFIARQKRIDREWYDFLERKQQEWVKREHEWRVEMERLQQQRMQREIVWRERQAQRRVFEENRAQRWDKLLTVLVNSFTAADDDN